MKRKRYGQVLVIIGIIMLSLNFISYLMNKPFVSLAVLPIGIALVIIGAVVTRQKNRTTT